MSERVRVVTTLGERRIEIDVDRQELADNMKLLKVVAEGRGLRVGQQTTDFTSFPASSDKKAVLQTIYKEYVYPILKKEFEDALNKQART